MSLHNKKRIIAAFSLLFFTKAVIYSLVLPPWQGEDEPQHLAYLLMDKYEDKQGLPKKMLVSSIENRIIDSMREHRFFELHDLVAPRGDSGFASFYKEARVSSQPRLYYQLAKPIIRAAGNDPLIQLYAGRLLSSLFGAVTVACILLAVAIAFGETQCVLAAGILLSLLPYFSYLAGRFNNDILAGLMGAAALAVIIALYRYQPRLGHIILLFLICLAGIQSKRSFVAIALFVALAIWALPASNLTGRLGRTSLLFMVAVSLSLIIVLLAQVMSADVDVIEQIKVHFQYINYISLHSAVEFSKQMTKSFIGTSHWGHGQMPAWIYASIGITLLLLFIIGMVELGLRFDAGLGLGMLVLLLISGFCVFIYYLQGGYEWNRASARYMLPAMGAFILIATAGMRSLDGKKWSRWASYLLLLVLLVNEVYYFTAYILGMYLP